MLLAQRRAAVARLHLMPEQLGNRVAAFDLDPPVIAIHAALSLALSSPPSLALLPAPLAAGALFLDAEVEFLDVLLLQQPLAGVGHHDAADLEHVAVVGGLQGHVGI